MRHPCVKLLVKEVQPIVSRTRLDQLPVAVIPLDNPAPLVGEYQRQHRIERSAFVATDTPTSVCLAMLLVARESSLDESVPVIGGGRKVVDLLPITCYDLDYARRSWKNSYFYISQNHPIVTSRHPRHRE